MNRHVTAIPWTAGPDGPLVALPDGIAFPSGEVGAGEHPLHGAAALTARCCGREPVVGARIGDACWEMRLPGDAPTRWFPVEGVRLSGAADRAALREFGVGPRTESTVLLVRHGLAGSKDTWHGPDGMRPLDSVGRVQADRLVGALRLWRPTRIVTAPKLRCVQTIQPFAEAVGLPIEREAVLSEDCNRHDALPALPWLVRAASGCTVVVCSQGGVIPAVVAALHERAGLPTARIRAGKGSLWALQWAGGRLIHADYYPDFAPCP